MGSDSRVRGADSVSTAAILPGPVQAWPRPDPAPTPPWPRPGPAPGASAGAAPRLLAQVCYVTAWTAPPTGRAEGRLSGKLRPPLRGPCAGAVGALCVSHPSSAKLLDLCGVPTCSPSGLSSSSLPFWSLNLPVLDPFQFQNLPGFL